MLIFIIRLCIFVLIGLFSFYKKINVLNKYLDLIEFIEFDKAHDAFTYLIKRCEKV